MTSTDIPAYMRAENREAFEKLADVKLIAEGTTFRAHKTILAMHSPVLAECFTSNMEPARGRKRKADEDCVEEDCSAAAMEAFLDLMYPGADSKAVITSLAYTITPGNCIHAGSWHTISELLRLCDKYAAKRVLETVQHELGALLTQLGRWVVRPEAETSLQPDWQASAMNIMVMAVNVFEEQLHFLEPLHRQGIGLLAALAVRSTARASPVAFLLLPWQAYNACLESGKPTAPTLSSRSLELVLHHCLHEIRFTCCTRGIDLVESASLPDIVAPSMERVTSHLDFTWEWTPAFGFDDPGAKLPSASHVFACDKFEWTLEGYLNGWDEECDGWLSLVLHLEKRGQAHDGLHYEKEVPACQVSSIQVSLISGSGNVHTHAPENEALVYTTTTSLVVAERLISRTELGDASKGWMPGGKLTIRLTATLEDLTM